MDSGFTPTQLSQLKELFLQEREHTAALMDARFREERQYLNPIIDSRFDVKISQHLRPLEEKIDRLILMETEDMHTIAKDVMHLNERVTHIEEHLATRV